MDFAKPRRWVKCFSWNTSPSPNERCITAVTRLSSKYYITARKKHPRSIKPPPQTLTFPAPEPFVTLPAFPSITVVSQAKASSTSLISTAIQARTLFSILIYSHLSVSVPTSQNQHEGEKRKGWTYVLHSGSRGRSRSGRRRERAGIDIESGREVEDAGVGVVEDLDGVGDVRDAVGGVRHVGEGTGVGNVRYCCRASSALIRILISTRLPLVRGWTLFAAGM